MKRLDYLKYRLGVLLNPDLPDNNWKFDFCHHGELDMCENCCKEDHFEGDDTCIICEYVEFGGSWWKRLFCIIFGHSWVGVYSWHMYCQRCLRVRERPSEWQEFGDGYLV